MKARLSLKGRALQLLAQRDQSRLELRRKLLRQVRKESAASPALAASAGALAAGGRSSEHREALEGAADAEPAAAEEQVEALLHWLEANRYLSNERFIEARVHARAGRFGNLRIRSELAQHGLALAPEAALGLTESEVARALAVRERRFPAPPDTLAEQAAQARFLAARGFSPEAIGRVLREVRRR